MRVFSKMGILIDYYVYWLKRESPTVLMIFLWTIFDYNKSTYTDAIRTAYLLSLDQFDHTYMSITYVQQKETCKPKKNRNKMKKEDENKNLNCHRKCWLWADHTHAAKLTKSYRGNKKATETECECRTATTIWQRAGLSSHDIRKMRIKKRVPSLAFEWKCLSWNSTAAVWWMHARRCGCRHQGYTKSIELLGIWSDSNCKCCRCCSHSFLHFRRLHVCLRVVHSVALHFQVFRVCVFHSFFLYIFVLFILHLAAARAYVLQSALRMSSRPFC